MDLGQLEAAVLGVVTRQGKATGSVVFKQLRWRRKVAYTTVSTTLERLRKKGLLMREAKIGRPKYVYIFKENPKLQKRIVDHFLTKLVNAFGPAVISSITERLDEFEK